MFFAFIDETLFFSRKNAKSYDFSQKTIIFRRIHKKEFDNKSVKYYNYTIFGKKESNYEYTRNIRQFSF